MVMSGMFLVLGVFGARIIECYVRFGNFICIEFVCVLILRRYAPVDIEEKRIPSSEFNYFKKRAMVVVGSEILLGIFLLCFERYLYAAIIIVSNLLEICSVIGGMIREKCFCIGGKMYDFNYNKYI